DEAAEPTGYAAAQQSAERPCPTWRRFGGMRGRREQGIAARAPIVPLSPSRLFPSRQALS
ncbi:MAG TPA: hypothetical protein VLA56_13940, partial [Pseudomonadales bacterium]|nr:hypothetical protein [Pseudomonadales bacterium]